ncbi:MAG: tRNA dihydrouridine synthase DusB [Bacteroidota bacterium]
MKIGNLDIENKLFLAPMAEVTDSSFRKIAKEFGAGITFTQMVSAHGVINNNFETLRLLSFSRDEKPIGVQILGNEPEILSDAVKEIVKLKPDLIDLNCGCSVDKVVSNNMGSALLDNPLLMGNLIRKMVNSSGTVPISVKLRLGKDRSNINILETARAAEYNGASVLFVHARTRADKYEDDSEWNWLKKVKETVNIPIVGNGSIFTPQDAKEMIELTGCDSAMVARGALGNPFIFNRFNNLITTGLDPGKPPLEVIRNTLLKQISFMEREFGEPNSIDKAKKHSLWYFRFYPGIDQFLEKIFSLNNLLSIRSLIEEHTHNILNGNLEVTQLNEINIKFKKRVLFWLTEENKETMC